MNKILHGLWHDGNFPAEGNYSGQWKTVNPGCEVRLWTFDEAFEVLQKNHPEAVEAYHYCDPYISGRCDMLRYAIIEECGGFYLDLDVECIKPFGDLFDAPLVMQRFKESSGYEGITPVVFGSFPKHPFWKSMFALRLLSNTRVRDARHAAILWASSPLLQTVNRFKIEYHEAPLTSVEAGAEFYTRHWSRKLWLMEQP